MKAAQFAEGVIDEADHPIQVRNGDHPRLLTREPNNRLVDKSDGLTGIGRIDGMRLH
jgi:hypothetical protein